MVLNIKTDFCIKILTFIGRQDLGHIVNNTTSSEKLRIYCRCFLHVLVMSLCDTGL